MNEYKIAFIYGNDNINEVSKNKTHNIHLLDYIRE